MAAMRQDDQFRPWDIPAEIQADLERHHFILPPPDNQDQHLDGLV